jgi:hypothetical protein
MPIQISKKSVSILIVILLVAFVLYQFLPRMYIVLATRKFFSKDKTPRAYILPTDRKLLDVGDQAQNKISYDNCEFNLPWKDIKEKAAAGKTLVVRVDKDKGMFIRKDEMIKDYAGANDAHLREIHTFDSYNKVLYVTPDQINLGTPYEEAKEKTFLLILKSMFTVRCSSNKIYRFEGKDIKGFQFGDPGEADHVNVDFFDNNNNLYHVNFLSISQKEIDFILLSVRCSANFGEKEGRSVTTPTF